MFERANWFMGPCVLFLQDFCISFSQKIEGLQKSSICQSVNSKTVKQI